MGWLLVFLEQYLSLRDLRCTRYSFSVLENESYIQIFFIAIKDVKTGVKNDSSCSLWRFEISCIIGARLIIYITLWSVLKMKVWMTYLHFIFSILRTEPAPEVTLVKSNGGVAISLVWWFVTLNRHVLNLMTYNSMTAIHLHVNDSHHSFQQIVAEHSIQSNCSGLRMNIK